MRDGGHSNVVCGCILIQLPEQMVKGPNKYIIAEIIELARQQTTEWDQVLRLFNERFYVPFELLASNKTPVMLGQEDKPLLAFRYKDGSDEVDITKADLLRVLSMGERRALYLINVIFEIQRRMKDNVETLVVVDDIADSFDYNNKYAIIQYLQEISRDGRIKLIIMTHNFDFFRTVQSRFVNYKQCLMATKSETGITLTAAEGIKNPFGNNWKGVFFTDARKQIASIPFLRNIIEMTHGKADLRYLELTSMLHWKADTGALTAANLDAIFNSICDPQGVSLDPAKRIIDLIISEANNCLNEAGILKLENKIVLAIGVRLVAERYVIAKINDDPWVAGLTKHQTHALIDRFRTDFPGEDAAIRVLDRVELMTPENIHVNAFMYEPIIDMGDDQLRKLYTDVKALA
jgi:AAA domain